MDRHPSSNPLKRVLDDPQHEQSMRFFRSLPDDTMAEVRWGELANMELTAMGPFYRNPDGSLRSGPPSSPMSFEHVQSPASVRTLNSPASPESGTRAVRFAEPVEQSEQIASLQVDEHGRPLPLPLRSLPRPSGITAQHASSSSAIPFASASASASGAPPPPPPAPAYATPVRRQPNNNAQAPMPQQPPPSHVCIVDMKAIQNGTQRSELMFAGLEKNPSGTYRLHQVEPGSPMFYLFLEPGPSCSQTVPEGFQQAQAGPSHQYRASQPGPSSNQTKPQNFQQQTQAGPSRQYRASQPRPSSNQTKPQNFQQVQPAASTAAPERQINLHVPESCRNGHFTDCTCSVPLPPIPGTLHLPNGTSVAQTITALKTKRRNFPAINIVQFVDVKDQSHTCLQYSQVKTPPFFIPFDALDEGEPDSPPPELTDDLPETPFDWASLFPVASQKDTALVPIISTKFAKKTPSFHGEEYQEATEKGERWKTAGLRFLQIVPADDNEWNQYARTERDILDIYELVTFHNRCTMEERAALSFVELLQLAIDKSLHFAGKSHAVRLFNFVFLGVANLARRSGVSIRTLDPLLQSYFDRAISPGLFFDRYNLNRMLLSVRKADHLIRRCRKILGNRSSELLMYIHNPQEIFVDFNKATEELIMKSMPLACQPQIHLPSSDNLDLSFLIWKFVGGELRNGGKLVPEPIEVEDDDYLIDDEMPYPEDAMDNSFDSLVDMLTNVVYDGAEEAAHHTIMTKLMSREAGLGAAYSRAAAGGCDVTMMMN